MTYYSAISYKKIETTNTRYYGSPSIQVVIDPQLGLTPITLSSLSFDPKWINSNNTTLGNNSSDWSGDYANYVFVNNSSNDWIITLPNGVSGIPAATFYSNCFQITIKKTGSGTLTIQTSPDISGTLIRGINSTSNKSYTLSSSSEQSVTLIYTKGKTNTGTTDSTAEIWYTT
jgi:hypothetical protein